MSIATADTMVRGFLPETRVNPMLRDAALIIAGSCLLALSAQVKLPIGPVPVNMTSFVVMMIGAVYGWRLGGATILAYWAEGIAMAGLMPWFANGSGLVYFLGAPSAGFVWGYLPMVLVIGVLADTLRWRDNAVTLFAAMLIGQVALYAIGLAHAYAIVMPTVSWMSNADDLLRLYLTPFIAGDLMKTALAALLVVQGWQWLNRRP